MASKIYSTRRVAIANGTCVSFCTFWPPWPRYAPGTIAVNVTWMGRGFNAGQTHRSMCPSIFNRLRAIARYWSEIATFSYPLDFNAPAGGVSSGIPGKILVLIKLIMGLPGSEDSLTIGWAVSTQYQRVTDRQTDIQPIAITCQYDWRTLRRQKWIDLLLLFDCIHLIIKLSTVKRFANHTIDLETLHKHM